ncbi:MAG: type VI secretion system protein TssA [Aquabacterium sp.]
MEFEALLAPVSASSPCGQDMSFSTEFDQIAEMRRHDDATLDQGEWITSLKVADWPGVAASCANLLGERTKDLRLAMWLTESWALTQGYAGLGEGLALCTELCARFWPELHPQADGGDVEERIGNIGWLLQRVTSLADALPATKGRQGTAFSLRDMAGARLLQTAIERNPDDAASLSANKVTLEQWQRALKETPASSLLDTLTAARQCLAQLLAWQDIIDGHLGANGPGFVQAKEALAQAVHELERLARDAGALKAPSSAEAFGLTAAPDHADQAVTADTRLPASPAGPAGPLRTREQALQQLRDVAQFFRRTEPHSPVAYLAEKAVKWGEMPLHEWLRQVVKDQSAMSHLQELLGLEDADQDNAAH